ncbi:MAG: RluA family pseudouridine synthase [Anaerolineaceae bacterium]|nr:RluA family pseudouridine synthase [Anaerolineaceae bacterium]
MDTKLSPFSPEWIIAIDDDLIIVNKPSGLRTIPDGYDRTLPCLSWLLEQKFAPIWVIHRLDKDTSGVVVFARSREAHRFLNIQFSKREVKKIYAAVIVGSPSWSYLDIHLPLQVNGDRRHRTIASLKSGKPARTEVEIIRRSENGLTLIKVSPHSGYTHQIRAHLAAIGTPILNDTLYSKPATHPNIPSFFPMPRLALHASNIAFVHPGKNHPVEYSAPFPADFQFI